MSDEKEIISKVHSLEMDMVKANEKMAILHENQEKLFSELEKTSESLLKLTSPSEEDFNRKQKIKDLEARIKGLERFKDSFTPYLERLVSTSSIIGWSAKNWRLVAAIFGALLMLAYVIEPPSQMKIMGFQFKQ